LPFFSSGWKFEPPGGVYVNENSVVAQQTDPGQYAYPFGVDYVII